MTVTEYEGYLSFGGNEIINNPRAVGIQRVNACTAALIKGDVCDTLQDALIRPYLSEWQATATNLMTNPSFEAEASETILRTNACPDPYFTMTDAAMYEWTAALITPSSAPPDNLLGYRGGVRLTVIGSGAARFAQRLPNLKPSTQYTVKFLMTSSITSSALALQWRPNTTSGTGAVVIVTPSLVAGQVTEVTATFTTPATVSADSGLVWVGSVTARTVDLTAMLIEEGATAGSFFAGDMPPARRVNMVQNPSMEPTGASWEVVAAAGLLIPDPTRAKVGTSSARVQLSGASTTGDLRRTGQTTGRIPDGFRPGGTYTIQADVWLDSAYAGFNPGGSSRQLRILVFSYVSGVATTMHGPQGANVAGQWIHLSHTFTLPSNADGLIWAIGAGGSASDAGKHLWIDAVTVEEVAVPGPYFDGDTAEGVWAYRWRGTPGLSPSLEYDSARPVRWAGAPDASVSEFFEAAPALTTAVNSTLVLTDAWSADRSQSMRIRAAGGSVEGYASLGGAAAGLTGNGVTFIPGHTYIAVATVRLSDALTAPLGTLPAALAYFDSGSGTTPAASVLPPNAAGQTQLVLNFSVPPEATAAELRAYHGATAGAVWWDAIALYDTTLPPGGGYFDGARPSGTLSRYSWTGDPELSASLLETRTVNEAEDFAAGSVASAPWFDPDVADLSSRFYGAYGLDIRYIADSTREAPTTENIFDGGTIGRMRLAMKEVRITALLVADGRDAMEYGRAWLDAATMPGACGQHDNCGTTDLQFYATCPPNIEDYAGDVDRFNADVDGLVRYLHGCAVTSGPLTVQEIDLGPENGGRGVVGQVVEFTVTVERPWVYGLTRDVDLPITASTVVADTVFNLAKYPSAEFADATDVVIATNYSTNPSVEVDTTGWSASAAAVSGTAPAAYFTSGRVTELAANGTASMRARILATAGAASVSDLVIQQDVAVTAGNRYSINIWAGALIAAGSAVSSLQSVKAEVEWRTATATIRTDLIGTAPTADDRQGYPYSALQVPAPATATIARVKVTARVGWANTSDIRFYADALAVTIP